MATVTKGDRRSGATPEDLLEFGDGELAGDPSVAALIAAFPEHEREAYRTQRRAFLSSLGWCGTYREFFEARR